MRQSWPERAAHPGSEGSVPSPRIRSPCRDQAAFETILAVSTATLRYFSERKGPSCTTRRSGGAHRAVITGPSWKRPPGRWSNPALSLPTEWSRPRISIDSGSWTQGPKSPLHQLSRHYRYCHIILMFGTSFRDIVPRRREGTSIITW